MAREREREGEPAAKKYMNDPSGARRRSVVDPFL